jgi:hypothetical protein
MFWRLQPRVGVTPKFSRSRQLFHLVRGDLDRGLPWSRAADRDHPVRCETIVGEISEFQKRGVVTSKKPKSGLYFFPISRSVPSEQESAFALKLRICAPFD